MPFTKGHGGKPQGPHAAKPKFNLLSIINTRFPALESRRKAKIEDVWGAKKSSGKILLTRYLMGVKPLTARESIKAQCCQCLGYYSDGLMDCENPLCPLYPFMPYRSKSEVAPCLTSASTKE
jgi:hypothetical protein